MTERDWMGALALHYEQVRRNHPDDQLLVVFDIDGTILDTRCMIQHLLQAYDRANQSHFFDGLTIESIRVGEDGISELLSRLSLAQTDQVAIQHWYNRFRWDPLAVRVAHKPFVGVLEVIRWFQLQPNTQVGLNSARPESMRKDTLHCLNQLGEEYKVTFSSDLLALAKEDFRETSDSEVGRLVKTAKMAGLKRFRDAGYRIVAMIDDEPENLITVASEEENRDVLLLHAVLPYQSRSNHLHGGLAGESYGLNGLMNVADLPGHTQFVMHSVQTGSDMGRFLQSGIYWGQVEVAYDPSNRGLVLAGPRGAGSLSFVDCLRALLGAGKGIKIDLREGGSLVDRLIKTLKQEGVGDSALWFNGSVQHLNKVGFGKLAKAFPGAILQCPVDFVAPLIAISVERADLVADDLISWGINRFSIDWSLQQRGKLLDWLERMDLDVNIYAVPDLESFLKAVLLQPRSITSSFSLSGLILPMQKKRIDRQIGPLPKVG